MSLKNIVRRRVYLERPQPLRRRRFGLLPKHADYIERARDYNKKKQILAKLREKARCKNSDAFRYKMVSTKYVDDEGIIFGAKESKALTVVQKAAKTKKSKALQKEEFMRDMAVVAYKKSIADKHVKDLTEKTSLLYGKITAESSDEENVKRTKEGGIEEEEEEEEEEVGKNNTKTNSRSIDNQKNLEKKKKLKLLEKISLISTSSSSDRWNSRLIKTSSPSSTTLPSSSSATVDLREEFDDDVTETNKKKEKKRGITISTNDDDDDDAGFNSRNKEERTKNLGNNKVEGNMRLLEELREEKRKVKKLKFIMQKLQLAKEARERPNYQIISDGKEIGKFTSGSLPCYKWRFERQK